MSAAYEQAVEYAMREAHLPRRSSLKQTRSRAAAAAARNNRNVDFSPDVTTSSDSDPQRSPADDLSEASYQHFGDAVNTTISRYAHHVRNGTAEIQDEKPTKTFPKETVLGKKPLLPRDVHIHHEIRVTTSDYSTEPSRPSSMDLDHSIISYQEQLQQQQQKLYAQQQQQQKDQQQQLYQQQLQQKLQQQLQLQEEQQRRQQIEEQQRLKQQQENELKNRLIQQQREKQLQEQLALQEHKRKAQIQQQEQERLQQLKQQMQQDKLLQQQRQQQQLRQQELARQAAMNVEQLAARNKQSETFAAIHAQQGSRQSSIKKKPAQYAVPRATVYSVAMPAQQTTNYGKGTNNAAYQVHPQQIYAAPAQNDINVNTISASSGYKLPEYYIAKPQTKLQLVKSTGKNDGKSGSMTCCWILMGGVGLTIALIVIFIAGSQLHIWDGII